jgi:NAD-dependent SIR2 family protein deacetylase
MGNFDVKPDDWDLMVRRIQDNRCVPFLGAGASLAQQGEPGLPTAKELAERLAKECQYPGPDREDLLRVTQYYQMKNDQLELRLAVAKYLNVAGVEPSAVHRSLAALPLSYVLTTNFDDLMERALRAAEVAHNEPIPGKTKTPKVYTYKPHGDKEEVEPGTESEPVVYKLHGSLSTPDSLVITEDDFVEFLSCIMISEPPLPAHIKSLFEQKSILFIGYGLKDWNIRVLMRAIRGRKASGTIASFAIQRRPNNDGLAKEWDESVVYWDRKEGLRCFDMDALAFCTELLDRYRASQGVAV